MVVVSVSVLLALFVSVVLCECVCLPALLCPLSDISFAAVRPCAT